MRKLTLAEIKRKRDGHGSAILIIPHVVLNCEAFITLSGRAVALLVDIAMQYNTYNNGAFLASWNYMSRKRGWTSSDQLSKAKAELIEKGFLVQTVQGMMPNKASWYGVTWWPLDSIKGLEIAAKDWPRGAYQRWNKSTKEKTQ